jgi:hypothetical protein
MAKTQNTPKTRAEARAVQLDKEAAAQHLEDQRWRILQALGIVTTVSKVLDTEERHDADEPRWSALTVVREMLLDIAGKIEPPAIPGIGLVHYIPRNIDPPSAAVRP